MYELKSKMQAKPGVEFIINCKQTTRVVYDDFLLTTVKGLMQVENSVAIPVMNCLANMCVI